MLDVSEGIDTNKTSKSNKCDICHYWYFLDKKFSYEPYLCNRFHDLMQKTMTFNDIAIVSIKGNDYRIPFWYMSKDEAISIMRNSSLNKKTGLLQTIFHYKKNEWNNLLSKKQRSDFKQSKRLL